jgi:predicted glycosyltransferase involved in capsule biosynthesis
MKIDYVVGYRERGLLRLSNFLNSLKNQKIGVTGDEVGIIVSVYGGSMIPKKFSDTFPNVRFVYTKAKGLWNRSKALNIGIRASYADVICCTDVDMIFSPNVAQETLKFFKKNENTYVYTNLYKMTKEDWLNVDDEPISNTDLKKFIHGYNKFTMVGTGGYQCMSKHNWNYIGGYRECYEGWGIEDTELYKRVYMFCSYSQVKKLPDECIIVHQYHECEFNIATREGNYEFLDAVRKNETSKDLGLTKGDL